MDDHLSAQHTKTSLPEPYKPQRNTNESAAKQISAILSKLALHYWRPDFTPAQVNLLMGDYLDDLEGKSPYDVDAACRQYRSNPDNQYFPRTGQLLELMGEKCRPSEVQERHSKPFVRYPALDSPRATKSVAEILKEHGFNGAAERWENTAAHDPMKELLCEAIQTKI